MPTGSASNDGATGNDGRDALDLAVSKALQRTRRPRPLPAAGPDPAGPPDELLLQYLDGGLDKDAHAEIERRLLSDPATRGRVAVLRSALGEPQDAAPASCSRYLFAFTQGKLRFLRGPSAPLPPESSPPQQNEIGFQLPGVGVELGLRGTAGGVELSLPLGAGGSTELRSGAGRISADGDGRFRGLGPARYELRICLGADTLPPIVLDIRSA